MLGVGADMGEAWQCQATRYKQPCDEGQDAFAFLREIMSSRLFLQDEDNFEMFVRTFEGFICGFLHTFMKFQGHQRLSKVCF